MPDPTPADGALHTALITRRNGCDIYAAATAIARDGALAAYCRTYWSDARRVNPELSKEPPTDDEQAITDYFAALEEAHCDHGHTNLDAIPAARVLDDDELASTLQEVGELTRTLSRQRADLARERIRRLASPLDISLEGAVSAGLALTEGLSTETRWEIERLLNVIIISEGENDLDIPTGSVADRGPGLRSELPSVEMIRERFVRELPRRQFKRRVRWSVRQLERIAALNDADDNDAADDSDAEDSYSEACELRDGIAENTQKLIAARRAASGEADASAAACVQVAYLMGVEVLVDLDERRVTRVVAIDESIELDTEEGAREQGTLTALSPNQTVDALAIAESTHEPWPRIEFGF